MMTEQQKKRIVELARECEIRLTYSPNYASTSGMTRREAADVAAQFSAEAFHIAQESK